MIEAVYITVGAVFWIAGTIAVMINNRIKHKSRYQYLQYNNSDDVMASIVMLVPAVLWPVSLAVAACFGVLCALVALLRKAANKGVESIELYGKIKEKLQ